MNQSDSTAPTATDATDDLIIHDSPGVQAYTVNDVRNRVILGDTFDVLQKLEAESVDTVFIDPPYFLQLPKKRKLKRWKQATEVEGVDDAWDKFASFEEYDAFITRLLVEVQRVMKPNATVWVISMYHSIFRIGKIMQDLGFWLLNDVLWVKSNPMPNWLGVRFTNATETMIWASRDRRSRKPKFDRQAAKGFGVGSVGANVWLMPICTGKERLKGADGGKLHSTQKPVELLRRVILTSTEPGDLILDPVAGTGTTGYVAQALERDFVMVEISPRYVGGMVERFEHPLECGIGAARAQRRAEVEAAMFGEMP